MGNQVKIVCTLGPASSDQAVLDAMVAAGLDAARLNFSHGDHENHAALYRRVRDAARRAGRNVAVIADLCGPKIRLGAVAGGTLELGAGSPVTLVPEGPDGPAGTAERLTQSYEALARDVRAGDPILINDGLVRLRVEAVAGDEVRCAVEIGGPVATRKGLNLPRTNLSAPSLTDKDRRDAAFARELGADYIALSFVRSAGDIEQAREVAGGLPVIAKIEKPEAVANLEAILDAADGAMVARGDLGVELGQEKVPILQKAIIRAIRARAKPVIVATQMLESMVQSAVPTRAEVSDVANSVLDGADAVMMSAETSVGRHPVEAVRTMAAIIEEVERTGADYRDQENLVVYERTYSSAIAEAVTSAAREYALRAIAVYTRSGTTAGLVSAERPRAGIIAFSKDERVLNRLAVRWGVVPLAGEWVEDVAGAVAQAERGLLRERLVEVGDDIAVTFGLRLGDEPAQTNMLRLWRVRGGAPGSAPPEAP